MHFQMGITLDFVHPHYELDSLPEIDEKQVQGFWDSLFEEIRSFELNDVSVKPFRVRVDSNFRFSIPEQVRKVLNLKANDSCIFWPFFKPLDVPIREFRKVELTYKVVKSDPNYGKLLEPEQKGKEREDEDVFQYPFFTHVDKKNRTAVGMEALRKAEMHFSPYIDFYFTKKRVLAFFHFYRKAKVNRNFRPKLEELFEKND